jgi:hypothetical protein
MPGKMFTPTSNLETGQHFTHKFKTDLVINLSLRELDVVVWLSTVLECFIFSFYKTRLLEFVYNSV